METSSRSSALVGLCATGGAVAVLTSAGLVPAIGLAFGLGGGWLLGQKLKSKTQKPQAGARLDPHAVVVGDGEGCTDLGWIC